jgi:hypothetical protein
MAKRKSKNRARREEEQRQREEEKIGNRIRRRPKALVTVIVCIAILVVLAAISTTLDFTNYNRCFNANDGPTLQSFQVNVYIQTGDATGLGSKFLHINNNTGILTGANPCKYSVHTMPNDPNTRGMFYTPLAVESPYTTARHQYTLGDFFTLWGRWLHAIDNSVPDAGIAFREGKVSYYTSPNVEVRMVPNADTQTAYPERAPFTLSHSWQDTPLLPGYGYYIIVHDPFTNSGNPYQ